MTPPDLSKLPPPEVVAQPDYETVLAALTAEFRERWPEYDATVESDPVRKLLEVFAWRETVLRRQVADAARAVMLAYAGGADLDHLAALLAVSRRAGESDEELRDRVLVLRPGAPAAVFSLRMLGAGSYLVRDLYDVACAARRSPEALGRSLAGEGSRRLRQIADELTALDDFEGTLIRPVEDWSHREIRDRVVAICRDAAAALRA